MATPVEQDNCVGVAVSKLEQSRALTALDDVQVILTRLLYTGATTALT